MHARLCPSAPRFLCQWVYISSSLWMFSEQHEVQSPLTERHSDVHRHIKRFVFTLFGFTLFFVSCHFLVFEPRCVFKEKTQWKTKRGCTGGCTSQSWRKYSERSVSGSLIRSPGTFMLFCLMNAPWHWQVWQILKAALRPVACMLGLMCQRGGPCSPTGTRQSPRVNISWHFPWQHAMMSALSTTTGERMIAELPAKTIFSPPDDACQNVCLCVSTTWNF